MESNLTPPGGEKNVEETQNHPVDAEKKPKRERRPRKEKLPAADGEEGAATAEGDEQVIPLREKREKKERPQTAAASDGAPKYRKKGEADPVEEAKNGDRPQTANPDGKPKRVRTKKPRADDAETPAGGEEGKEQKPKKKPEQKYRKKGETPEGGDEAGDTPDGGEETKKEAPEAKKNTVYFNPMDFKEKRKFKSKWEEYRHGDWRKGSGKTYVTPETIIPEMPEGDQLLKLPDENSFHKRQVEIEEKIKEIGGILEEKKTQFEDTLGQKKAGQQLGDIGVPVTKELGNAFAKMKELKKEREIIFKKIDECLAHPQPQKDLMAKRDFLMKKIDKVYNTEELVPKGIKEAEKKLHTTSGGKNIEQQVIKRIQFLRDSIPHAKEKDKIDEIINLQMKNKKEAQVGMPQIKVQIGILQKTIDKLKEAGNQQQESRENFDKSLDDINEKRKKLRENRDKLYKEKEELRDTYYGGLIVFQKQQYLLQDIKWMNGMKKQIQEREAEKERRNREYQERKERIQKEREEKVQREEDRKKRIQEKKEREVENKRIIEEQARDNEVEQLKTLQAQIDEDTAGSNPMFDQIQQCESLLKFCSKQLGKADDANDNAEEAKDASGGVKNNKEIENALKKGSIQLAPTKAEREKPSWKGIAEMAGKGKKGKKSNQQKGGESALIDFNLIKKFNSLKISAPLGEEQFQATIDELNQLKAALVYWGKIIQRQNKIKHIRNSRKIKAEEEFQNQAEQEEKYIENEKSKFEGDDVASKTDLSLDKLKAAQEIDRENRMNKAWDDPVDDDDEESDEGVYNMGDMEDGEDGIARKQAKKGRGGDRTKDGEDTAPRENTRKPKQTQRPNAQKFAEIMRNDQSFPALDNQYDDDNNNDEDDETPNGEISN